MRNSGLAVVEAIVPTRKDHTNLRRERFLFALDQRAFGPGRVLVAFADRRARFVGLAHTRRPKRPEDALDPCIQHMRTFPRASEAVAAVAYCDERVNDEPPGDMATRFAYGRLIAMESGIHLVDWFACDDERFRSSKLALEPGQPWWQVP